MKTTMWLARSQAGILRMFPRKPIRYKTMIGLDIWTCGTAENIEITDPQFLDITYSNSPVPVEVELSNVTPLTSINLNHSRTMRSKLIKFEENSHFESCIINEDEIIIEVIPSDPLGYTGALIEWPTPLRAGIKPAITLKDGRFKQIEFPIKEIIPIEQPISA